ncbi:NAD-dependent epimerase/dehydratase family protein [Acetobacter okinawensis]|uniref:NAD-dependent epimerase/dehydratase family protein n=1 Tax=Acetobacter okinawensis TaxID=1076594 RepID=UPI00209D8FF9|nr:NAD(P)-dependent oxidoreductase [Acetobacter okinawensis]MCP1212476.1 NAD(P)-dependent oxidoreductase [Acetobacter okinawensis]
MNALLSHWQKWSIVNDFQAIDAAVGADWAALDGARIFMTGGTGFVGGWLLESLHHATQSAGRQFDVTVLSRDPAKFYRAKPHLASWKGLQLVAGNVSDFAFADGPFDYLLHAATDASAALNRDNPRQMFETILGGTRRALDFAVAKNVRRTLFLSSGAVYGQQPWNVEKIAEDWTGAPQCNAPVNAYAEGKRAAEMLCAIYGKQFGTVISTARIFAVLGPYLSLDTHFAAGNFIRDAMQGQEIIVQGDGRPCRSYLYAADLSVALLRMLARGPAGIAYNVGSEHAVSIADLAGAVARVIGGNSRILGKTDSGWNPGRYIPAMSHFNAEFGAVSTIDLDEAIARTALWNGWKPWVK